MRLPIIPAAFFGIVLGLVGLGSAWRLAAHHWGLSIEIGETTMALAVAVWVVLTLLYALKWLYAREAALAEAAHPVQCCFIGLAGVATMLAAFAMLPYTQAVALVIFTVGAAFTLLFGLWRTGILWQGGREIGATTPVLYLPSVAGGFVTATLLSALGHPDWGQLFFGAAFFSWLAIESVLLHRFYMAEVPVLLRPTLGIQLAPANVGAVAYLSVNGGHADLIAHALVGYGLFQALLLLRLLPWIRQQPFSAGYWSFTFGATALAGAVLRMAGQGDGVMVTLAPYVFVAVNAVLALIILGTLRLLLQGRLLPSTAPAPAK